MGEELLHNQDMAYGFFQDALRQKHDSFFTVIPRGRHRVYKCDGKPSYYAIFKRDWFHTFNNEFPEFVAEYPYMKGLGESVNMDVVTYAKNTNIDFIALIHPSGDIYVISPLQFYRFAERFNLIRGQKRATTMLLADGKLGKKDVNEVTMSIPATLLSNYWEAPTLEALPPH